MSTPVRLARRYRVAADRLDEVLLRLRGLDARARALGIGDLTVDVDTSVSPPRLRVSAPAPRAGRWQMLARIEHHGEGIRNTIVPAAGQEGRDLAGYLQAAPVCDHCGLTRRRRETYLLSDDRSVRQIGTSCLAEFTQIADAERLLRSGDLAGDLTVILHDAGAVEEVDAAASSDVPNMDASTAGRGLTEPVESLVLLAHCSLSVAQSGWVGRSSATPGRTATVDVALRGILGATDPPGPLHWARAAATLTWARTGLRQDSHYARRIRAAAALLRVDAETAPSLAAALPGWLRAHASADSRPVGRARLQEGVWMTVQFIYRGRSTDGQPVVTLRDRFANRASLRTAEPLIVGGTYRVTARDASVRRRGGDATTELHDAQLEPWEPSRAHRGSQSPAG